MCLIKAIENIHRDTIINNYFDIFRSFTVVKNQTKQSSIVFVSVTFNNIEKKTFGVYKKKVLCRPSFVIKMFEQLFFPEMSKTHVQCSQKDILHIQLKFLMRKSLKGNSNQI